jgi:hypothetical protein
VAQLAQRLGERRRDVRGRLGRRLEQEADTLNFRHPLRLGSANDGEAGKTSRERPPRDHWIT